MGGTGPVFIEGDSNVIDEEEEYNNSMDNIRRKSVFNTKNNKSLDNFEGKDILSPVN